MALNCINNSNKKLSFVPLNGVGYMDFFFSFFGRRLHGLGDAIVLYFKSYLYLNYGKLSEL